MSGNVISLNRPSANAAIRLGFTYEGRSRVIEFVEELPKTISGKIRRVEIREKDK